MSSLHTELNYHKIRVNFVQKCFIFSIKMYWLTTDTHGQHSYATSTLVLWTKGMRLKFLNFIWFFFYWRMTIAFLCPSEHDMTRICWMFLSHLFQFSFYMWRAKTVGFPFPISLCLCVLYILWHVLLKALDIVQKPNEETKLHLTFKGEHVGLSDRALRLGRKMKQCAVKFNGTKWLSCEIYFYTSLYGNNQYFC
jgi:hypothetical protein